MVANAIGAALGDTEVTSIARFRDEDKGNSYDTLGIVFPVYWGGLPLKVLETLSALKDHKASYIFAVVTHAGGPGRALPQLNAELQQIGLELSSGFYLRMPSNYVISYDTPNEDRIRKVLEDADRIISGMVEIIKSKAIHRPSSDFPPYSGSSGSYQQFIDGVKNSDEKFWVDDSCTECEVCVRVCPVQNIRMKEDRPEWLHECEQCLACINWCPEKAIQFGTGTESRGRYQNPRVTIGDMEL